MKPISFNSPALLTILVVFLLALCQPAVAQEPTHYAPAVRYDLQGNEIWRQQLPNGFLFFDAVGHSVVVSDQDTITILDSGWFLYPTLTRLNRQGQIVWQTETRFTVGNMQCNAQGECYIFGDWTTYDDFTRSIAKYDADGNLAWRVTPEINQDAGYISSIAFDSAGNLIVNCSDYDDGSHISSAYLLKLDPDGNPFWNRVIDAEELGGSLTFFDIYVLADDSIIATGHNGNTIVNMRISPSIFAVWVDSVQCATSGIARGDKIALDPDGNLLIQANCSDDVLLMKYDIDGNLLWSTPYDSNQTDVAGYGPQKLIVDENGDSLIIGYSWPTTYLMKIDADGNTLWYEQMDTSEPNQYGSYIQDMTIDAEGNVYLVGYSTYSAPAEDPYELFTKKFSPTGSEIWSVEFFAEEITTDKAPMEMEDPSVIVAYPFSIALLPAVDDNDNLEGGDNDVDDDSSDDDNDNDIDDDDDENSGGCGC